MTDNTEKQTYKFYLTNWDGINGTENAVVLANSEEEALTKAFKLYSWMSPRITDVVLLTPHHD